MWIVFSSILCLEHPTIAQLAERETVEAQQLSLGHWFESGWSETFLFTSFILLLSKTDLNH